MKAKKDEFTVSEAAEKINIHKATLNSWITEKKAPAVYRGRRRYMKASAVLKIEIAIMRYGADWFKHISFDSYEKFISPFPAMIDPASEVKTPETKIDSVSKTKATSSVALELAVIARKLKSVGENELAARVSLRAVELM